MSENADDARACVGRLIGTKERLPESIRRDILGLESTAVPGSGKKYKRCHLDADERV